jgi:FMN-dependent NADH-azoreductase
MSVSRQVTAQFASRWQEKHPAGQIIYRDLYAHNVPLVDLSWIQAAFVAEDQRTVEQKAALSFSETAINELMEADSYVFGVPMFNFSVPAVFKAYVDQIVRVNRTFQTSGHGPKGLLQGKTATFAISSSGSYSAESPMAQYDFLTPYLRTIFGFLGVTEVRFIQADGLSALGGKVPALDERLVPVLQEAGRVAVSV